MSVITVENLRYRYPHTKELALDGLDFSVEKGEFIGIIGENGAGKSTLSQAIMGLVPQFYKGAYGGMVTVDGIEAGKTPVAQLCGHVGLVFQNPFNQLSGAKDNVYEEVAFGMQNLGVPAEEMKKRVEEALKLLDIWQYPDRRQVSHREKCRSTSCHPRAYASSAKYIPSRLRSRRSCRPAKDPDPEQRLQ